MKQKGAIGLTGGIACGKSVVADVLTQNGIPVLDTDVVAHSILRPGHKVFDKVVNEFGAQIIDQSGQIDRRKLGELVFGNDSARNRLNEMMHPEIFSMMHGWLNKTLSTNQFAVVVVPLLFETKIDDQFEKVLVVASKLSDVKDRLQIRGLTDEQADQRIQAQMPLERKIALADGVIWNNSTIDHLVCETRNIWNRVILERKK